MGNKAQTNSVFVAGILLCMRSANDRWHYSVKSSPIGWAHAPRQWEVTFQRNVVSHWLGKYTKWSLYWEMLYNSSLSSAIVKTHSLHCALWAYDIFARQMGVALFGKYGCAGDWRPMHYTCGVVIKQTLQNCVCVFFNTVCLHLWC